MIPKWEHKIIDGVPVVDKMTVERYLGYYVARDFMYNKPGPNYPISEIDDYIKSIRCTAEKPNPERPNYSDHDFEFGYVGDDDHGDEIWFCKHCRKRWVKEGPDA